MTLIAAMRAGHSGELAFMNIAMAIQASGELDFVFRGRAGGSMTCRALQGRVAALQRIFCGRVLRQAEFGRFETLHGVTRFAFASVGAGCELSSVRVGMVTLVAGLETHRLFEVISSVTFCTAHSNMFAEQRIPGGRVVEFPSQAPRR
jgi:hypothetical protein